MSLTEAWARAKADAPSADRREHRRRLRADAEPALPSRTGCWRRRVRPSPPPAPRKASSASWRPDPSVKPAQVDSNSGKPGFYTIKPGDTLIRIGLDNGQNWKRPDALEQPGQPESDRGRPGHPHRPAGSRPGERDIAAGDDGTRRDAAARCQAGQRDRAAGGSGVCAGRIGIGRKRGAGPGIGRVGGAARGRRRRHLGLARRVAGVDAVRRRAQQGAGLPRQAGRPGLCGGRRPGRLRGLGSARLRQPRHPQAQRDLPHRLRPQPDAAGQGRPAGQARPEDRRDGIDGRRRRAAPLRDPQARAGRSIRPASLPAR